MAGFEERTEVSATEAEEAAALEMGPCALQLISCGDESDNYAFKLLEKNLDVVLKKVPKESKVAVVSVVGAFRTGKSFLLTLILRYLRFKTQFSEGDWLSAEGDSIDEGNANNEGKNTKASFAWRAGRQRMTTGISIWSEPFQLSPDLALLVLDTQGLFDNETTMGLTSCIFGLSTLMSSYQIYNVANRIQEDNLQQLALFTEYGRMAVNVNDNKNDYDTTEENIEKTEEVAAAETKKVVPPPFQRLEFLVRDWPEFDESMSDEEMESQMATYLEEVLAKRQADDLAFTREQILTCFADISCWLLPHPGFAVTKLKYDGSLATIEELFKRGVSRFLGSVFSKVSAKTIGGAPLTAMELGNYVKAYVGMFADGARFPQARTMLEATATANNRSAKDLAFDAFNDIMDKACGTHSDATFLPTPILNETFKKANKKAQKIFQEKANMGRQAAIDATKTALDADIAKAKTHYKLMNDARNPFLNAHLYAAPLAVAASAWVVRKVTDTVCPEEGSFVADSCNVAENFLREVYMFILFATLAYIAFKTYGLSRYLKQVAMIAFEAATNSGGTKQKQTLKND